MTVRCGGVPAGEAASLEHAALTPTRAIAGCSRFLQGSRRFGGCPVEDPASAFARYEGAAHPPVDSSKTSSSIRGHRWRAAFPGGRRLASYRQHLSRTSNSSRKLTTPRT